MAIRKKRASKNPQRGGVKDAVALLKQDHAEVKKLLSQLEATSLKSASKRQSLLGKIALEVRIHARIEEEIFYPAFRGAGRKGEDQKTFFEAREEHGLVDHVLPQLEGTDPQTELFSARAKVLKDLIEHHAEEEEDTMFPRAKELLERQELVELGAQMKQRKDELKRSGGEELTSHANRHARRAGETSEENGHEDGAAGDERGTLQPASARERGGRPGARMGATR